MKTKIIKIILLGLGVIGTIFLISSMTDNKSDNPFGSLTSIRSNRNLFNPTLSTCTATTSPTFINNGTGNIVLGGFSTGDVDSVALNILALSTTTPPTLKYRYEFSDNLIDWYPETRTLTEFASTTQVAGTFREFSVSLASSTGGTSVFSAPTSTILVQTPHHSFTSAFTRVAFYVSS